MNLIVESQIKNYLGLFDQEGNVDIEETRKFMEISRAQMAEIFKLTPEQLRPDRIGKRTQEKLTELAGALEFIAESYEGDVKKAQFWIKTPNPHLGGSTPRELILRGRYKKVMQFILSAKAS
jgi:hypothetical protein